MDEKESEKTLNELEYELDFVIPCGVTGPTGPTGPKDAQDICFASYTETRTTGDMNIQNSILLPKQNDTYTLSQQSITVEKNGIYEVTFCGILEGQGINNDMNILLLDSKNGNATTLPDMSVKLPTGQQILHFSETSLYEITLAPREFIVQFVYFGTGTASASSVNVTIKKLSD